MNIQRSADPGTTCGDVLARQNQRKLLSTRRLGVGLTRTAHARVTWGRTRVPKERLPPWAMPSRARSQPAHGPSSGLVKICSRPRTNALTLWIARQAAHRPSRADRVFLYNNVPVVFPNAVDSDEKLSHPVRRGPYASFGRRTGAIRQETEARALVPV